MFYFMPINVIHKGVYRGKGLAPEASKAVSALLQGGGGYLSFIFFRKATGEN